MTPFPSLSIRCTAGDIDMIYYFSNLIMSRSRPPGPPSFTSLDSLSTCSPRTCTRPHCRNRNLNRRRLKYLEWTLKNYLLWGILIMMFVVVKDLDWWGFGWFNRINITHRLWNSASLSIMGALKTWSFYKSKHPKPDHEHF